MATTAKGRKAAETRKRNQEAQKTAQAEVSLQHRLLLVLSRLERRLNDGMENLDGPERPPYTSEQTIGAKSLQPPGKEVPGDTVPSVASLTEQLTVRTTVLRERMEGLMGTLLYGPSCVSPRPPEGTADRKSEGPTKDSLLAAHTNLTYVEGFLDRIGNYLLA